MSTSFPPPRNPLQFSSADLGLAARLEAAESANAVVMARAATEAFKDAAFQPFAGGAAVFAGIGSPMTHALGIGLQGPVPTAELECMEDFFRTRGSACLIDLCPLADPTVTGFVQSRPYRIVEFNNVLARRISPDDRFTSDGRLQLAASDEIPLWSQIVSEAFSEYMPPTPEMTALMSATCGTGSCWVVRDPHPVGGAAMGVRNSVALFYGDALLPASRRRGWQSALIQGRLAHAQSQGCDLAVVTVLPGSGSHRNYLRAGFQLVYMRVNLSREFTGSKSSS